MFKIKQKNLDHFAGFALALLVAFPMLRVTILPLPGVALVFPIIMLFAIGALILFRDGNIIFKWKLIIYVYAIILLFIYLLLSVSWSFYNVDHNEDIVKILFIITLIISLSFSFSKNSIPYLLNWILIFAIFTTFTYIYHYLTIGSTRGYGIPAYLTRSMILGLGAIISISKLLFFKNVSSTLYSITTIFLFFGLSISLGRAALLGAVVISAILIAYYYYYNWPKSYSYLEYFRNKSSIIALSIFCGLMIFAVSQIERTFSRLMRLFTGAEFRTGRVQLWKDAFWGFFDAPIFGHGLSNSGAVINFNYPHNLFLQVMVDGGIIGLLLLWFITFYPIILIYNIQKKQKFDIPFWIPLLSCYIFLIMLFSLSTNYYEGRILISLGLIIVLVFNNLKK